MSDIDIEDEFPEENRVPVVPPGWNFEKAMFSALPSLRAFAISLTGRTARMEDLVQETLMKAWAHKSSFQPGSNMNAWLYTILRNEHYSAFRKVRHEVEDGEGEIANRQPTRATQDKIVEYNETMAAIKRLTPDHREALLMVCMQGLSYEDAAALANCAVGTMKSRVNRARAILAGLLEHRENAASGRLNGGDSTRRNQGSSNWPLLNRLLPDVSVALVDLGYQWPIDITDVLKRIRPWTKHRDVLKEGVSAFVDGTMFRMSPIVFSAGLVDNYMGGRAAIDGNKPTLFDVVLAVTDKLRRHDSYQQLNFRASLQKTLRGLPENTRRAWVAAFDNASIRRPVSPHLLLAAPQREPSGQTDTHGLEVLAASLRAVIGIIEGSIGRLDLQLARIRGFNDATHETGRWPTPDAAGKIGINAARVNHSVPG